MAANDKLFDLIRSLSKNEKGYFKKQSRFHQRSDTAYLLLFDAIDRQEAYDEKKLLRKFHDQAFAKQLTVAKNYLYDAILDALESYHEGKHKRIFSFLSRAEILLAKGLYTQMLSAAEKAVKLAEENEAFALLPLALRLRFTARTRVNMGFYPEALEEFEQSMLSSFEKQYNAGAYSILASRTFLMGQTIGLSRSDSDAEKFKQVFAAVEKQHPSGPLSISAQADLHKALSAQGFSTGNFEQQYRSIQELVRLYTEQEELFQPTFSIRLNLLLNLSSCCIALYRFEEAEKVLGDFDLLQPGNEAEKIMQQKFSFNLSFNLFSWKGNFKQAAGKIEELRSWYARYVPKLDPVIRRMLPVQAAYLSFGAGNYPDALKWINIVLQQPESGLREDVNSAARIIDLLVHYELGHTDLLEYKLKSAYRYLAGRNRLHVMEKAILAYLKKLPSLRAGKEAAQLLSALRAELEAVSVSEKQSFLEKIDLISWIESKQSNIPFDVLVAQKYLAKSS